MVTSGLSLTPKWWSLPSSGEFTTVPCSSPAPSTPLAVITQAARTSPSHPACAMSTQPLNSTSKGKRPSKMAGNSLNYLLNFTLPPRQSHHNQSLPRRTRRSNAHPAIWNKESE